jgi:hypothetical protein
MTVLPESALDALETRAMDALRALPEPGRVSVPWADCHDADAVVRLVEELRLLRTEARTYRSLRALLRRIRDDAESACQAIEEVSP